MTKRLIFGSVCVLISLLSVGLVVAFAATERSSEDAFYAALSQSERSFIAALSAEEVELVLEGMSEAIADAEESGLFSDSFLSFHRFNYHYSMSLLQLSMSNPVGSEEHLDLAEVNFKLYRNRVDFDRLSQKQTREAMGRVYYAFKGPGSHTWLFNAYLLDKK